MFWIVKCLRESSSEWIDDSTERDVCVAMDELSAAAMLTTLSLQAALFRVAGAEHRQEIEKSGALDGVPFLDRALPAFDTGDQVIRYYAAPLADDPTAALPPAIGSSASAPSRRPPRTPRERQAVLAQHVEALDNRAKANPGLGSTLEYLNLLEYDLRVAGAWSSGDRLIRTRTQNRTATITWYNARSRDNVSAITTYATDPFHE